MRPLHTWNLGPRRLELGRRTLVMGIVNVTPDSFSDGGRFISSEAAIQHSIRLLDEGADMLDIGGESTRPGAPTIAQINESQVLAAGSEVSAEEELARVLPVIEGVHRDRPEAILSIDTYKASVAVAAVRAGTMIVNDVSGLRWDPEMGAALARLKCGTVLMHTRGRPEDWRKLPPEPRIYEIVERELQEIAGSAVANGIGADRIVLDPGFGFGKNFDDNYPLLARLQELRKMGFPLLVGVSRKSFLGRTAGVRFGGDLPVGARLYPSVSAAVIAAMHGAHIVRVHDVRPTVEALAVADAVMNEISE